MPNADPQAAWEYHDRTKHSLASVQADQHVLDWTNQPIPYKRYRDQPTIPLPRTLPGSHISALEAIADPGETSGDVPVLDSALLASVLHHTAGITKRIRVAGGTMDFRAAACTGALYHIDFYLVCGELPGLAAALPLHRAGFRVDANPRGRLASRAR